MDLINEFIHNGGEMVMNLFIQSCGEMSTLENLSIDVLWNL